MNERKITTEDAERMMKQLKDYIFKNMYGVGDIYTTTNPDMNTAEKVAAKYGGTWVAWDSGYDITCYMWKRTE